jgi:hypothetical protein
MSNEMVVTTVDLYEAEGPDWRLRVAICDGSDEPPFMQSVGKTETGSPMSRIVSAAALASDPDRDKLGLFWRTRDARIKAMAAAKRTIREMSVGK